METPIDAEDDFAANLENIDENNSDGDDNTDDEEKDTEDNIDWNIGDVEEPEQDQLDPSLWDMDKNDAVENLDQNNESKHLNHFINTK